MKKDKKAKKDKSRFTLRFCNVSPKQITAMEILNAAGRRKASLIADLIDEHIKKYGADAFIGYFNNPIIQPAADIKVHPVVDVVTDVAADVAVPVVSNVVTDIAADVAISAADEASKDYNASNDSLSNESPDDETRSSILEGLSMFRV